MDERSIATAAVEAPVGGPAPGGADGGSVADPTFATDPRVLQILTTEHWSLLSARGLAYNEAFTRASMLLSFLAMSFVALALLAQATGFTRDFLLIAVIVFGFDFVIGLVTLARIGGANADDLRAMHGMARIRHGYTQIVPQVAPYFVTPTHDDIASVLTSYSTDESGSMIRELLYGLSTSFGLVGLILGVVGGLLAGVAALAVGASGVVALVVAAVAAILVLAGATWWAFTEISRIQASTPSLFPASE